MGGERIKQLILSVENKYEWEVVAELCYKQ